MLLIISLTRYSIRRRIVRYPDKTTAILLFLSVLMFVSGGRAFCGWEIQKSAGDTRLNDIAFVDELHGWAVGDSSLILATVDGGDTWIEQESPVAVTIEKVYPVTKNRVLLFGRIRILITEDGGKNWSVLDSDFDPVFVSMSFVDALNGWATNYKKIGDENTEMWRTRDGGHTWEELPGVTTSPIYSIRFVDEQNGWLSTGPNYDMMCALDIYHTTDSGVTWEKQYTISSGAAVTALSVSLPETVWVEASARLYRSTDGGNTWNYLTIDPNDNDKSFGGFFPFTGKDAGNHGYSFLGYINKTAGFLYIDFNRGEIIELEPGPVWPDYWLHATVAGNIFWTTTGTNEIWRYTPTTTEVKETPKPFALDVRNYPNPFNPSTSITYGLPRDGHVTITVRNLQGQLVETLQNRFMTAGTHTVVWMPRGIGSGVYFCTIESGNFVQTRKMLFLK